jgi:hypothetical protein
MNGRTSGRHSYSPQASSVAVDTGGEDNLAPVQAPNWTGSFSIIEGEALRFPGWLETVGKGKQIAARGSSGASELERLNQMAAEPAAKRASSHHC